MASIIQLSASQHDERMYDTRMKGSLGIYCIRLDNITVGELTKRERLNVKRLQGIFKEQGCLPLDQENYIKAAIDSATWDAAAARLQHSRRREGFPQELFLRADEYVDCKQGKCRIEAAKVFLQDPFRWWTVSLYKKEQGVELFQHIGDEFSNEQAPSDGNIYIKIQHYSLIKDVPALRRFWAYLTPHKRRRLKHFLKKHPKLAHSFNSCLPWEALWQHSFYIGVLHKLTGSRCDEELLSYMGDFQDFWQTISGNGAIPITESTVEVLEGRCPAFSESDRQYLQKMMDEEQFLSHLNHDSKARVFADAAKYVRTVPSFHTFFEDLKYVEICSDILKAVLWGPKIPRHDTLRQGFAKIYQFGGQFITQRGPEQFWEQPCDSSDDAFLWAYCQLWLCAMRFWPYTLTQRPRQDPKMTEKRHELVLNTLAYKALVANTAQRLGFVSKNIVEVAAAAEFLVQNPEHVFSGFVVMDSEAEYRIEDRCGIPVESTTDLDRDLLFINQLLGPDVPSGKDVNSLFVRRVFFQRLFPQSGRIYRSWMHDALISEPETITNSVRPAQAVTSQTAVPSQATAQAIPPNHSITPGQSYMPETSHLRSYRLTIYKDTNRMTDENYTTLQERNDRAFRLQKHRYVLMTDSLKHLEPSSISEYRGHEIIASHHRIDIRILREKKGLGARQVDPNAMEF